MHKTYNATIKIATPVYIGSGDKLDRTQYARYGDTVYVIDESKLSRELIKYGLVECFIENLSKPRFELSRFFDQFIKGVKTAERVQSYHVAADNESESIPTLFRGMERKSSMNDLLTFTKTPNGEPYIPGSSVKGAIRTALLYSKITDPQNANKRDRWWGNITRALQPLSGPRQSYRVRSGVSKEISKTVREIENSFFRADDIVNNEARQISVSDSRPISIKQLGIFRKIDRFAYKEDNFFTYAEYLKPRCVAEITIGLSYSKQEIETMLKKYTDFVRTRVRNAFNIGINKKIKTNLYADTSPNLILGGNTGFYTKSLLYALAPDDANAAQAVKKILDMKFSKRSRTRDYKEAENFEQSFSPRAAKTIRYKVKDNYYYLAIGLCELSLEET